MPENFRQNIALTVKHGSNISGRKNGGAVLPNGSRRVSGTIKNALLLHNADIIEGLDLHWRYGIREEKENWRKLFPKLRGGILLHVHS